MRRMVVVIALGTLSLCSGCVSPSERVPMNRSFTANSSWLGGPRRQSVFRNHPAVREPSGFFGPSAAPGTGAPGTTLAGAAPARPLPSAGTELVARPVTPRQETLPRFFPGLFGQNQGDPQRLASARAPERAQLAQANANAGANTENVAASRLRFTAQRDQIAAASAPETAAPAETPAADNAVRETAAEVDANDNDAPLLPVALDVKAYPVKPSASLPVSDDRAESQKSPVARREIPAEPVASSNARAPREERPLLGNDDLSTSPPREDLSGSADAAAPRTDQESTPASAMIAIPGLDDTRGRSTPRSRPEPRPEPAPEPAQERVPTPRGRPVAADHPEPHADHADHAYGRPQLAPTSARASATTEPGNDKFRVTPRQGANATPSIFEQIKQEPRRGPISRLWHRMRGEG